jgi:L-fuconolactonase
MGMSRRSFLARASGAAVVAGSVCPLWPALGADDRQPSIPVVDTHQHLWDLSRVRVTWLRPPLDRSFTPQDYTEATRGLNVVKAVYMEVAVPRDQRLPEAEYVLELCEDPTCVTCAAVLAGSPMEDDFEAWVMRFKDNPYIKGFRGGLAPGKMAEERTVRNLRMLGTLGMRFDVNVQPSALAEAARLVESCPETRFVLDHCGNADPVAFFRAGRETPRPARHTPESWKRDIDAMAARSNIVCKISGIVANVPGYPLTAEDLAPIIDHCLDAFGPDRVIFATDWPVCLRGMPLRDWVGVVKQVTARQPETDRRKLFHDNAIRFYDLATDAHERV